MTHDDLYNLWCRQRAESEPSPDFAERVLEAVRQEPRQRTEPVRISAPLARLFSSPIARAAVCVLACLVCLLRLASVIGVYIPH
jgi:hypothetical protein